MADQMREVISGLVRVKLTLFREFPAEEQSLHALLRNHFENFLKRVLSAEYFDILVIWDFDFSVFYITEVRLGKIFELVKRMLSDEDQTHDIARVILLKISFKDLQNVGTPECLQITRCESVNRRTRYSYMTSNDLPKRTAFITLVHFIFIFYSL